MNNFLNFVKEHIIIILIVLILIIVILSISISPYFLLVLLPLLPLLYIANNKSKSKKIFSLLDKYKPKKIKTGSNDENTLIKDKIDQYVITYIENMLNDDTIYKDDMDFLLILLKIKIDNKYNSDIQIKKYINEIADKKLKELSNLTYEEKEKEKKDFVEYYNNFEIDIYKLSDNIKEYFKYEIDEEIFNKFPDYLKINISYLQNLFQVIDDIKSLGTVDNNDADLYLLKQLQNRSENKNYRIIYDYKYYKDYSDKLYNYIYDSEIYKKLLEKVTYDSINKNDPRYQQCMINASTIPTAECYNSMDPLNYNFYFELYKNAIDFKFRSEDDFSYTKEPDFIPIPDDAVPNFDNIKENEKPFYAKLKKNFNIPGFNTNNNTETTKPNQANILTTFILEKGNFIISKEEKDNINNKPKTCPVYNMLDKQLTNDTKECRKNTLKIHPSRNLGCVDLATRVTQSYNTKCHFGSGN